MKSRLWRNADFARLQSMPPLEGASREGGMNIRRRSCLKFFMVCCFILFPFRGFSQPLSAAVLRVAAAADLKFALDEIIQEYQRQHPGIKIEPSYGSSGNFVAQITNQAPFDLFLSANLEFAGKIIQMGLAVPGSDFAYARGRIVLWAPFTSPFGSTVPRLEWLKDPRLKHLAIANPRHAPYGMAAEAALRNLGCYDIVASKLVYGENVAQALQFVQSGMAEAGIVALALVLAPATRGSSQYWEIPQNLYPRMDQGGVILKSSQNVDEAWMFRQFLLDSRARDILKRYGFALPGE